MEAARKPVPPALQMRAREYASTTYVVVAGEGVRPEDTLVPGYWAHLAAQLKPWDRLEVRATDGTWLLEALVLESSRTWARVRPVLGPLMLGTADIGQTQAAATNAALEAPAGSADEYDVKHRGPRGWSVVRKADAAVLHEGSSAKAQAQQWLDSYLQNTPRAVAA